MLSTSSTREDVNEAIDLGTNDYIIKPVNFKKFRLLLWAC